MTKKPILEFRSEIEEQEFWSEQSLGGLCRLVAGAASRSSEFEAIDPDISLRLPEHMIEELKFLANKLVCPTSRF